MFNVDLKMISKPLLINKSSSRFVSSQESAFIKNIYIDKSGRLISDIIGIPKIIKEGLLVTMDMEKHLKHWIRIY